VNLYFSKNPPVLKFKKLKKFTAIADRKNNIIYIDLKKAIKDEGGLRVKTLKKPKHGKDWLYLRDTVNPSKKERIFLTLLHEIAHFKLENKFEKLRRKYLRLDEKIIQMKGEGEFVDPADIIKPKKNESDEHWCKRLEDFTFFLKVGVPLIEEKECEYSALEEFKRKRADINKIIEEEEEEEEENK